MRTIVDIRKKIALRQGLTLIELLVSMAVFMGVLLYVGGYIINILNFQNYLSPAFETQQELQSTLADMSANLRTMNYSSLGGYPIASASTSSITFFVDYNSDGIYEQVHYFLASSTMWKGVLKPTGNPLVYNPANEITYDVIHDIVSTSSVFSYYSSEYAGNGVPMTYPIDISKIKIIGISVMAQQENQQTPMYASMMVTPRNIAITF